MKRLWREGDPWPPPLADVERWLAEQREKPEWVEHEARVKAEIAAGEGMSLSELRRFLGLDGGQK